MIVFVKWVILSWLKSSQFIYLTHALKRIQQIQLNLQNLFSRRKEGGVEGHSMLYYSERNLRRWSELHVWCLEQHLEGRGRQFKQFGTQGGA